MADRGSYQERIAILERLTRDLERRLAEVESRSPRPAPEQKAYYLGKLDGALSQGGSATVSIWAWDGSAISDTTANVTAYDWFLATGESIASGAKVYVELFRDGRYYVLGAECG